MHTLFEVFPGLSLTPSKGIPSDLNQPAQYDAFVAEYSTILRLARSSSRTLFGDSRTSLAVKRWSAVSVHMVGSVYLPSSLLLCPNGWRYREDILKCAKQKSSVLGRVHYLRRPSTSHLSHRRLLSPTLRQCIPCDGEGSIQRSPELWPLCS